MSTPPHTGRRPIGSVITILLIAVVTVVAMVVLPLLSRSAGGEQPGTVRGTAEPVQLGLSTDGVATAAAASEALGWRAIQADDAANRVVSPSSLSISLAMAAEGAGGVSQVSIDEALGLSGTARSEAYSALRQALEPYDSLPGQVDVNEPPAEPVVHQTSRVVAIEQRVEQPFLDATARYFDAAALEVSRDSAQSALDAWAGQHTAGLIEKSGIEVTPNTQVVTQDALLFAAAWRQPFANDKAVIDFAGPDGTTQVDAVGGVLSVRYAEGERWQAVRLPYDDNLAADIILPTAGVDPVSLTAEQLRAAGEALSSAAPTQVSIVMPRLDLTAKTDLTEALPDVDLSDLSGIIPGGASEQWVQQVRLQVSAKGTVGAALTEGAVAGSAPLEPRTLVVDRPYVMRVLDVRTSWPLFLAAIAAPGADAE